MEERWEQIALFQRTGLWTEPAAPATAQDVEETPLRRISHAEPHVSAHRP